MSVSHLPNRLGRFEIQSSLGAGGFALVVRAYDPQLSSSVAIKILSDRWTGDADARDRFLAEARHLRRVRSPSVVAVHDIGELDDGRPYFVMELADRGSLEQRLAHALTLALDEIDGLARLIGGLAEGMGAIHEAGLVHRDLNPRNLLLRSAGGESGAADVLLEGDRATAVGMPIVRADERLLIADLGLAKDIVVSGDVSIIGGSVGYQAPEQLLADGELGPWSDVYAASALIFRVLSGTAPPPVGEFEGRRQEVAPEWRVLLRRGLDPDAGRRHPTVAEWAAEAMEVLGVGGYPDDQPGRRSSAASGSSRSDECPYRGLASYEPEHAASFFGRSDLRDEAIGHLRDGRTLAVLGASGSGKSSLVRAGVIPALQAGELPGSEQWPVILMTPGADPMGEMQYQLRRAADREGLDVGAGRGATGDPAYEWRRLADAIVDHTGGLVICADQFEEIFTHDPDGVTASRFLDALAAMVEPTASRVKLVLAMRADFYAEAAGHQWLARRLVERQILVGPMDPTQLRSAIVGPAERAGLEIEDGLVEVIVREVGTDPGSLPLLGHALVETWRRREGRRLTIAGFRDAGGVAGAISQTAESVFADTFDSSEKVVARDLMLRMVSVRHGAAHTRRKIPLDEIGGDGDDVTAKVVDSLIAARLVTVDDQTLQIAHEALIVEWPRLRQWIDDSIDDLRLRSHLSRAAVEWQELDQDPAMLYRGTPLATAQEWAARSPGHLGPTEREFLAASTASAQADADRRARDARRQRRARALAIGAGVGLLVIGVIAWAGIQRTRSIERSNAADARILENLGLVAQLTAETDPLVGLALGVEALARTEGSNSDAWLAVVKARQRLAASGLIEASVVEVGDALSVAVSSDGNLAAVGSRSGGQVSLVRLDEEQVSEPIAAHEEGVPSLAFRADGNALATASFDGTVRVWAVSDGSLETDPTMTIELGVLVWDLAWSPDGTQLATATEDGTVRLWNAATGAAMGDPLVDAIDMLTVAFSGDGSTLVAANGSGLVWGFALPGGDPLFEAIQAHESDVWELVFSPDGAEFATSSSDGTVRRFRTADGQPLDRPFIDDDGRPIVAVLQGVHYTSDGRGLVAGSGDGEVLWWDREIETVVAREGPPGGLEIIGAGRAGDLYVTLSVDQSIREWHLGETVPFGVELPVVDGAIAVAVAPDRSFVATADGSGTLRLHDVGTGDEQSAVPVSDGPLSAVSVSPDSSTVAVGTDEGEVVFVDVASSSVSSVDAHDDRVRAISFHPSGDLVATGGRDGIVRVWDLATRVATAEFGSYGFDGVEAMTWDEPGERLAVAGFRQADVWSVDGGHLAGPTVADDALYAIDFSADGTRIAVGGNEQTVTVWSADLERRIAGPFATLPGGVQGVAFVDDDAVLAAVAADGSVRLWDLESELLIGEPLRGPWSGVRSVSVLESGPLVATASDEGQGWLWNLLDQQSACSIIDGLVATAQPTYLGEGGRLTACEASP